MTIEGDKNQSVLVPTAPDARKGDPEEEATTVWGKADLFGDVEADDDDDDLFGDEPPQPPAPATPASPELPRHTHEGNRLNETNDDAPAEDEAAPTVEMTAEQAAALAAASRASAQPSLAEGDIHDTSDDEESPTEGPTGDDLVGEGPAGEIAQARPAEDRPFEEAPLVQLSGAEKDAAEREAQERAQELDTDQTRVVKARGPRLTHDCRMCGKKVTTPRPRRFRGSTRSEEGFRCDRCGNVFCAAHVVRVSGIFSSLFGHATFRCQLCNLDKT